MSELSDDILVAHVDGQLKQDQSRAVERVLDEDEVAAQRVAALKSAHEQMEAAFDALLAGEFTALTGRAPPDPAAHEEGPLPAPANRPAIAWRLLAAGLAGCLLIGAVAGYGLRATLSPDLPPDTLAQGDITGSIAPMATPPGAGEEARMASWQDEVSRAYALYGRDWLETTLDSQGNRDFVEFQLAKVLGARLAIPDLSEAGLAFKRAQVLHPHGEPVAQIAYLPEDGPPVALFAKPDAGGLPLVPSLHATGDVAMASWSEDGIAYLLAARLSEDRLVALTELVRRQLAGPQTDCREIGNGRPRPAACGKATDGKG